MKIHPVDAHVGKQLRLKRSMLGLSQGTLGGSVGITFQQIQKYEHGVNRISTSMLHDLAKVLSVPITYFFEGFDEKTAYGFAEEKAGFEAGPMNKEISTLVKYYSSINDPKVRKKVLSLVKSIASSEE